MTMRLVIVMAVLSACATQEPAAQVEPPSAAAPLPATCSAVLTGPVPVGGGNPSCKMDVTITVTCDRGAGQLEAVFGETGGPTLYAASAMAAYECGIPVTLERWGISCAAGVAADVNWDNRTGGAPTSVCPVAL